MNITLNRILRPLLEALPENNRLERIWILAKVDFQKRYYNSILGLFWALLNPLFRLLIYFIVFTMIFKSDIPNFGLYLFLGLVFWLFFAEGTKKSFNVLSSKRYLIENIQLNKLDIFYSAVFSVFFGFLFNLTAYFIISLFFNPTITFQVLWLFVLLVNVFLVILGVMLILATISIYIRDINQIWDMVLLAGLWLTPIFYGRGALFEKLPFLLYINPIAGLIINARETVLYGRSPDMVMLVYNLAYGIFLVKVGVFVFNRYSHKAAEKL